MLDAYLAVLGGLALVLGVASRKLRDLPVSEPLVALVVGVLLGPVGLGWLELPGTDRAATLAIAARIALALSVMAVALRFPLAEIRMRLRPVVVLTLVGMLGMAALTTGLSALVLGLPAAGAWLLGAALAPTDPVLSSSIVEGGPAQRDLPLRLRLLISIESAANDGLAAPLVTLGVVLVHARSLAEGAGEVLAGLAVAVVVGAVLGYAVGRLVEWAERHRDIEHSAFLALTLSLTAVVLGVAQLARGDAVLAVFVAGLLYNHAITRAERSEEWEVQEAINRFLVLPVFALLGVALPWGAWGDLGWRGPAFVAGVLVLRRLPVAFALARPLRLRAHETLFLGWFGPVGVAALLYLTEAVLEEALTEPMWAAGTLAITANVVVHGLTATPGRRRFARAHGG
ncbi:MAG TPA: cation:proton antiporter [Egibacteraceae bacterium]|nr:cation:proton antiporter [Egibacteraceae bacterium]